MKRRTIHLCWASLCLAACRQNAQPSPPVATPISTEASEAHEHDPHANAPETPDASPLEDAGVNDVEASNTAAGCVDLAVSSTAVGTLFLNVTLQVVARKNIGFCGCVSAVLRYRVLRGQGDSLAQLATGTINSFRHSKLPFKAHHRVAKAGASYVVAVNCDGG